MRLAIIADIHGNYQALQAVLADIASLGADRIFSLGDNIGYGPQPEEVVCALRDHQVVSVMGNHELALVSRAYCNRLHATARESLLLTRALLSDLSLSWLEGLPAFHLYNDVRFVHGCPPQSITVYLFAPTATRLSRVFASYPERICFAGHTHDLGLHRLDGEGIASIDWQVERKGIDPQARYLFLPGSVGQPRDTLNWHAKYMLWDLETATLEVRALIYDVRTTIRLLGERGFPVTNAKRLYW
jgi:diadenosine tetraphosphatase ApaH/serine/threonine PP2A family protein phosphatase